MGGLDPAPGCPGTSSKRPPPSDDESGRRRDPKRSRSEPFFHQPFACPLYAAYPKRYSRDSLCASRGWIEIPRLKEHIYRCHYQTSCDRCLESFKQDKDLVAHRRQATPCPMKDNSYRDPVVQGIGQDKMSMLKSRKRSSCQNAEEKWFEIWSILFPDLDRPESAYNRDANLRTPSAPNSTLSNESLGNWRDQLADHLAVRLRESLLPAGSLPSEQDPHLFRNHILNALRDYPGIFPTIPTSDDAMKQPKMEDMADLQGPSPHGSSGSCLSLSTTDGFSDGDSWMMGSPQTPSMSNFTFDQRVNMGTGSGVKFMSIDWSNGSSAPRYVPVVPNLEGTGFLPCEELQGPLELLHIGSEAMPTGDTRQIPHEWYDINDQYPDMWNLLNDDTSGSMGVDDAQGDV